MIFDLNGFWLSWFSFLNSRSFVHWKQSCQFKSCPCLNKLILDNEVSLNDFMYFFSGLNDSNSFNLLSWILFSKFLITHFVLPWDWIKNINQQQISQDDFYINVHSPYAHLSMQHAIGALLVSYPAFYDTLGCSSTLLMSRLASKFVLVWGSMLHAIRSLPSINLNT